MKSIIEQASSIMKAIEKAWNQAEQPKEFSIKIFEKEERNFFGMTTKPAKIGIFFGDKPIVHDKQPQKPRPEIKECRPEARENKPKITTPSSSPKTSSFVKTSADKLEDRAAQTQKPAQQGAKQEAVRPTAQQKPAQQSSFAPSSAKSFGGHSKAPADKPSFAKTSSFAKAPVDTLADKPADTSADKPEDKPRRTPAAWNDTMITTTHNWLKKTLELMNMSAIEFSSEIAGKNLKLTFNKPLITDAMHEKQLFRSFAHLIMSSLRNQYKQEIKDLKVILIRPE